MKTGEKIKERRKSAGLTQAALAKKLNVSTSVIGQYETGYRTPKFENLAKIATAIGCPVTDLIGGDDYQIPTAEEWASVYQQRVPDLSFETKDSREASALLNYRQLNDKGQIKANEYIEDLLEIPKYTEK